MSGEAVGEGQGSSNIKDKQLADDQAPGTPAPTTPPLPPFVSSSLNPIAGVQEISEEYNMQLDESPSELIVPSMSGPACSGSAHADIAQASSADSLMQTTHLHRVSVARRTPSGSITAIKFLVPRSCKWAQR